MTASRSLPTREAPKGLRLGVNLLLILGVLAMHHLFLGGGEDAASHHDSTASSTVAAQVAPVAAVLNATADVVHEGGITDDPVSDCGGLMAFCMAMLLGVSAYIVLRKRLADRVLWQLPPPTNLVPAAVLALFDTRSPPQRIAVLRC